MEMSQGNSLVALLNKQQSLFFFFFFSFTKSENRQAEQVLPGGGYYQWERGEGGENVWEVHCSANTVCMYM
jgi:hypothetical protein